MAQFLQGLDTMGQFYKDSATGLGQGLAGLAQAKMKQIEKGNLAKGLGSLLGLSPEESHAYSNLPPEILKEVVKGKISGTRSTSPAQQKADEEILGRFEKLHGAIGTYKEIREILEDPKLELGIKPSLGIKLAPTQFDPSTEFLDKLSDDALNAESSALKGRITNAMFKTLARTKPGVQHSLQVNKHITENKIKTLQKELSRLQKDYPNVISKERLNESLGEMQQEQYTPEEEKMLTTYIGDEIKDADSGDMWVWNQQAGRYVEKEGMQ